MGENRREGTSLQENQRHTYAYQPYEHHQNLLSATKVITTQLAKLSNSDEG